MSVASIGFQLLWISTSLSDETVVVAKLYYSLVQAFKVSHITDKYLYQNGINAATLPKR